MGRWVISFSESPRTLRLEDLLIKPDHSIVKQVHERFLPGLLYGLGDADKEELKNRTRLMCNDDGFGAIWYKSDPENNDRDVKPAQYRSIAPIATDLNFKHLCSQTESSCIASHIRDATYPPVIEVNNHPFTFGNIAFQHDGFIASFDIIRFSVLEKINQLQTTVQAHPKTITPSVKDGNYIFALTGNSDTEHLALLFTAYFDIIRAGLLAQAPRHTKLELVENQAMLMALILAADDIQKIQKNHLVGSYKQTSPWDGNFLNIGIVNRGSSLLVTRWRDSPEGQPSSLYISFTAGEKLDPKDKPPLAPPGDDPAETKVESAEDKIKSRPQIQGLHLIVGSEPCTRNKDDWGLFGQNQGLIVNPAGIIELLHLKDAFSPEKIKNHRDILQKLVEYLDAAEPQPPFPMPHIEPDGPEISGMNK
ncbi:hypothetical protein GYMLUDRAFT_889244 [Collybiopsis luxurians FD-317 M1]|uniref:Glutamine amidotransferase type-2 domain-containing protein n=1 Tax=Collybiopsis luxurians FD-317 M1 TaxID=944289 RepID=A0A0D0AWD4_9AGAR|nr:hypothetical protein GYMLUDRAFT_889244 [Collybiopsis luxurians FD-317 M1]